MIKSSVTLFAFSENAEITWGNLEIQSLLLDIQAIETRIINGSNIDNERTRYSLIRDRIEFLLMYTLSTQGKNKDVVSNQLGPEYFEVLSLITTSNLNIPASARIGSSVFPLSMLEAHINGLRRAIKALDMGEHVELKHKLQFFRHAHRRGMHVVEIVNPTQVGDIKFTEGMARRIWKNITTSENVVEPQEEPVNRQKLTHSFMLLQPSDQITENSNQSPLEIASTRAHNVIRRIANGDRDVALNFSDVRNDLITEVLWQMIYGDYSNQVIMAPIVYMDGSHARPFPIGGLAVRGKWRLRSIRKSRQLNIGLLSARHPEMDPLIDFYWFRNQEISQARTHGETDDICYEQSRIIFEQMRESQRQYNIAFYQTGLEPALIGFFRALAEVLLKSPKRKPWIEVIPMYFRSDSSYEAGAAWH